MVVKKIKLSAKTFDQDKHEYVHGYRRLVISWTDAMTIRFTVNFALMSTKNQANILG